jgi:hypothetical protein
MCSILIILSQNGKIVYDPADLKGYFIKQSDDSSHYFVDFEDSMQKKKIDTKLNNKVQWVYHNNCLFLSEKDTKND